MVFDVKLSVIIEGKGLVAEIGGVITKVSSGNFFRANHLHGQKFATGS